MATAQDAQQQQPPAAAPGGKKSAPGQPWSHLETVHLIDAYEERWTAVRRGQLKAQQWEDVAGDVAARCAASNGGAAPAQPKTGTQCRHKIEKLRKRFRAERARPVASLWPYFRRMERLERGPLPVSALRPSAVSPAAATSDEDEDDELPPSNTRSINGILRDGGFGSFAPRPPPAPPAPTVPPTAPPRKRAAYEAFQADAEVDEEKEEEVEMRGAGGGAMAQLVSVLRGFCEGMMRVERRRMEVRREMEREWMDMESRRAQMVMDAQRRLLDTVTAAFTVSGKKDRRDHGGCGDGL